jgi:hypothetical protein
MSSDLDKQIADYYYSDGGMGHTIDETAYYFSLAPEEIHASLARTYAVNVEKMDRGKMAIAS